MSNPAPGVELERLALDSMRFYFGGRCAVMFITNEMVKKAAAGENDMEGLAPIPRQIEGVWVGVTLREKADGTYKVSVRTGTHADASAICAVLGGGGHVRAAGCTLEGSDEQAAAQMLGGDSPYGSGDRLRKAIPSIALPVSAFALCLCGILMAGIRGCFSGGRFPLPVEIHKRLRFSGTVKMGRTGETLCTGINSGK